MVLTDATSPPVTLGSILSGPEPAANLRKCLSVLNLRRDGGYDNMTRRLLSNLGIPLSMAFKGQTAPAQPLQASTLLAQAMNAHDPTATAVGDLGGAGATPETASAPTDAAATVPPVLSELEAARAKLKGLEAQEAAARARAQAALRERKAALRQQLAEIEDLETAELVDVTSASVPVADAATHDQAVRRKQADLLAYHRARLEKDQEEQKEAKGARKPRAARSPSPSDRDDDDEEDEPRPTKKKRDLTVEESTKVRTRAFPLAQAAQGNYAGPVMFGACV